MCSIGLVEGLGGVTACTSRCLHCLNIDIKKRKKKLLFVVGSLDKHVQNEKELIRLRRFMPAARTTLHQGGSNFACGANYPHQALKGGYFVFVWRVGT